SAVVGCRGGGRAIAVVASGVVNSLHIGYLNCIWLRPFIVSARVAPPAPSSEETRRPPTTVAQLFVRHLEGMTELHDDDQERPIHHRSRDRAQCRRKAGPAH